MHIDLHDTRVGGFNYELLRALSTQGTGAAELGECMAAAAAMSDGDTTSWIDAWTTLAERLHSTAERFLAAGQHISAREALMRASNAYRAAVFYATSEDPRHTRLLTRSRECAHQAMPLFAPPIEVLEIPFSAARLPGYFVCGGEGRCPTLLALGGFDSTAEELLHWIGFAAAERGWHALIFEGPGQWSALQLNPGLHLRPDYEAPVQAVVDYALTRPEIDDDRLALIGYSLGGYLAPRAAALEPRLRACIADSLVVDVGEAFRAAWPPLLRRAPAPAFDALYELLSRRSLPARWAYHHARWAMGIHQPHDFFAAWRPYSLHGLEDRLDRPLLCLFGEDEIAQTSDRLIADTIRFVLALRCPREIRVFSRAEGAASHCQMGGLRWAQATVFDWLERALASGNSAAAPSSDALVVPADVLEMLERYHSPAVAQMVRGHPGVRIS